MTNLYANLSEIAEPRLLEEYVKKIPGASYYRDKNSLFPGIIQRG
jgi:hypothetical protein